MNNVSNNVSLNSKSVLDADDDYNDNSISPTGMKYGKKITGGKVEFRLVVLNYLRLFLCLYFFTLLFFVTSFFAVNFILVYF
jgi:hypothetical protein